MRKNILKFLILVFVIGITLVGISFNGQKNGKINKVLKEKEYSYLPVKAQNYIEEVYNKTGQILKTEKNKEENQVYLNPRYVDYLALSDREKAEVDAIPNAVIVDYNSTEYAEAGNIPSNYDLRNVNGKNFTTPNRNQGQLGICWTFATAGVTESYILKNANTSYSSSSRLIAERQLDYALSNNGIKAYTNNYSVLDRSLGTGGNFYSATIPMASAVSLFDYNNFKSFSDTDLSQMELSEIINYDKSLYEVNSTINFPSMNLRELTSNQTDERTSYLNEVKQNIMNYGGAYTQTYMHSSCKYKDSNNNTIIDVNNCTKEESHAMQIIGWNDNYTYTYCNDNGTHNASTSGCSNVVTGKGVWILKNSWGTSTPNPYMAYDSADSIIAFLTGMESTTNKIWDNNYLLGEGTHLYSRKTYELSSLKIKNNEKLKKVKFVADDKDNEYYITVYPTSDTNNYQVYEVTSDMPGLVTFNVPDNITVSNEGKILINGYGGYFLDKLMLFTSNIDTSPYIDMSQYDDQQISSKRYYATTKNIPSGTTLTYKLYNEYNRDMTSQMTVTNNKVAANDINTLISFDRGLSDGIYTLEVLYNSNVISSINLKKGNVTYTPKYTVSFNANGGTGTMESVMTKVGTVYIVPNCSFTRENYDFVEWNTKRDGTGTSYLAYDMILNGQENQVITLYAQWQGKQKTIIFDSNGGIGTMNSFSGRVGTSYSVPNCTFTNGDYRFVEWNTSRYGTGTSYQPGQTINLSNLTSDNYTLYAIWEGTKYLVSFNMNGSTLTKPSSISVFPNQTITLPTPSNNNTHVFLGWYKESSCTNKFTDTYITSNTTLYAKYAKKINVTTISGIVKKYYTGKNITQAIKVYDGSKLLTLNTDYKLTYSNNKNIGTATVTITGINKYGSSVKKAFYIIPKAPVLKKVTSPSKGKVTLQYTGVAGGVYYQVAYKVKGGKAWKKFNTKGTKITKKGFASKKYYYFNVRSYRKVGTKVYYSPWSNKKTVKIK